MTQAIHFTHANGIPSASYQKFFQAFEQNYHLKAIPLIGMNPEFPVTYQWTHLVDQVIQDIEKNFPNQKSHWFRAFFWFVVDLDVCL